MQEVWLEGFNMTVAWHHGTCDNCQKRLILVCHFGYNTQPERDYRLCKECMIVERDMIEYAWKKLKIPVGYK